VSATSLRRALAASVVCDSPVHGSAAPRRRARAASMLAASVLAGLLALTGAAGVASAGETADKLMAQKLLKEGNQLLGDGDYVSALQRFRAAYARFPSAKILLNIGTTLRQLGHNLEAAEVYETYLKDPKADPARAAGLVRILKEIDAVVGRLRIEVNEPGARVKLDGKEVLGFKSGLELRVEPGGHTVVAEREGFPPAVQTLDVGPHEQRVVSLLLSPPEKKTVLVTVSGPQRTISYVFGGVGAAGLVAGAAAGIVAIQKNQAAKAHCGMPTVCDAQGVDLGKTAKTSALVSTVALAAGGGALVTGVVLFFTSSKAPPSDAPAVALGVSHGPFVTVEGTW
jgi:hypothetical protein